MPTDPARMRADDLRVLQVIPVLAMGGLERVASRLTIGLSGRVARVSVAGKTGVKALGSLAVEEPLRAAGVTVHHIPRAQTRPDLLLRAAVALAPVLRRERPDVVHAHNPIGGAAAAIARALTCSWGTAIVTTYHGVEPHRLNRATRVLALSSDLVVGVGPTSTRALQDVGLTRDRSATVYNAVSVAPSRPAAVVREEFGVPADAELVVTVGRYMPEKNQALLLEALALLAPRRPRLRALVVGVGRLEDELRRRVLELGQADRMQIVGPRADAVDITAAADVFALSSWSEGLPLVVLEAMALGVPVVTTNVGGVGDAVRDGETGLLVPAGDVQALAAAIDRLLDDRELREGIAARARAWVDATCSEDVMIERYRELYTEAVARRRTRSRALRAGASPSK